MVLWTLDPLIRDLGSEIGSYPITDHKLLF
jgi:hypothetical protein